MDLLDRYFDTAVSAPDGIKQLRELILTLAMQGKLVPQDPNDQPAGELLRQIDAEKKRLVKEGKIRAPKPLLPLKPEDVQHRVPPGWVPVRFGELALEIATGPFGSMIHKTDYVKDGVPLINPSHMIDGEIVPDPAVAVSVAKAQELRSYALHEGDIVMARRGEMGRCAVVDSRSRSWLCGTGSFVLRFAPSLDRRFIVSLFRADAVRGFLGGNSVGTTMTNLNHAILCRMPVLLPPLPEQHRIVARVDELMARCDELEKLRAEREGQRLAVHAAALGRMLDAQESGESTDAWQFIVRHFGELYSVKENVAELRKAILQLAVMGRLVPQDPSDEPASELLREIRAEKRRLVRDGTSRASEPLPAMQPDAQPFPLPDAWMWVHLEDVVEISSGITKGRRLTGANVISIPYLRVANVQRGYLDLTAIKDIEILADEVERFRLQDGDLLITEGGDWDKVGRASIWRSEIPLCAHQNHVFRARKVLGEQNEVWLEAYLNSPVARSYFAGASKQTTNLASINKTQLRGCPVPIPPLPEQHRIVAKVDQVMAMCDALEAQIDAAEAKRTELLDAVMAGV